MFEMCFLSLTACQ